MNDIIELTHSGFIEGRQEVGVSLGMLSRFLLVYPSIITDRSVGVAEIAETLGSNWKRGDFIDTDKPLTPLYRAAIFWMRHVVGTSIIKGNYSKVSILIDVGENREKFVLFGDYDSSIVDYLIKGERLSTYLGTRLARMVSRDSNPVVFQNTRLIETLFEKVGGISYGS